MEVASDCKFLNFPQASQPAIFDYEDSQSTCCGTKGRKVSTSVGCVCFSLAHFFKNGIDMDDVLAPTRAALECCGLWKLSFIKIDDDENQALIDAIVRRNQHLLVYPGEGVYQSNYQAVHNNLAARLSPQYRLHSRDILAGCARETYIAHEMAIEAGLLEQLAAGEPETVQLFGNGITYPTRWWPLLFYIDYMDKIVRLFLCGV